MRQRRAGWLRPRRETKVLPMISLLPVITIDGPTASGKGTVAHSVADALHWHYLDSGALYRLTALACLRANADPKDAQQLTELAQCLPCEFRRDEVYLAGERVDALIRQEPIGNLASIIAAYPGVRTALLERQRAFRQIPGLVADGRDMGTVVFPDAVLKVFLTAEVEVRANRRVKQLKEKGISANFDDLLEDLRQRDQRDAQRANAPLVPAADARILDSSGLEADQVVHRILQWFAALSVRSSAPTKNTIQSSL